MRRFRTKRGPQKIVLAALCLIVYNEFSFSDNSGPKVDTIVVRIP